MKKVVSSILAAALVFTAGVPTYAMGAKGFTPPGLAKKGGLPPGIAKKFKDLDDYGWAREAIERLAQKGIVSGMGDGIFAPSNNVTKIEALAMIIRAMDWDDDADLSLEWIQKGKLEDKMKNKLQEWTKGYIEVALKKGLIDEVDLAQQNFTTPATRQEIAKYIVRALGLEGEAQEHMDTKLRFKDTSAVQIGAVGYIYLVDAKGIMKGYPDGTFRPNQPVKRAEMASLISTLDEQLGNDDEEDAIWTKGKLIWFNQEKVYIEKDKDIRGYELGDEVKVYINGKQEALKNLKTGEVVELKVIDKEVEEIRCKTDVVVVVEESFKGTITDVDKNDKEIIVKNDSKERLFKLDSNTEVRIDGKTKSFGDLTATMRVEVQLADGKVTKIIAETTREEVKGILLAIDSAKYQLKIQLENGERLLTVDSNTYIVVDGAREGFDKLVLGMQVEAVMEGNKLVRLYAQSVSQEYKGTLVEKVVGTQNKITIQIGNQTKAFVVAKDAELKDDEGNNISFEDLKVSGTIKIGVKNNIIVKIHMEN